MTFSALNLATASLATATPDPDPTSTTDNLVEGAADAGKSFWDWFSGWPLQILLTLLIGSIVLALLRRMISHVTERIATGAGTTTTEAAAPDRQNWRTSFRRAPIVEGAMSGARAITNPLANPKANERRAQRARTVGSVLRSTANIVVGTMMALMILQDLNVNVAPLLASAGVAGIALGFGMQSLVRDFISGIFLLVEDQFGVGDVVNLGGAVFGTVEEVQLRVTQVRAFDGTLWYVRNGEILQAGNTTQGWGRALAEVPVPLDSDLDTVRAALGRAADRVQADEEIAPLLFEAPSVRGVDAASDFSLTFTLHAQVRPGEQWEVARALRRAAQVELLASGVLDSVSGMQLAALEDHADERS